MSEIKDLQERIDNIQKILIKRKLEYLVAERDSNETDIDSKMMMEFDDDDFGMLMEQLHQEGLSEGSGYIEYMQEFDFDEFADNTVIKIDGQLYEFTLESGNIFSARALTKKPTSAIHDLDTDKLVDIDLDELFQIDSKTLEDTPIAELYDELAEKRIAFMTLKLSTAIKDIQDGKEPSSDTELTVYNEEQILNWGMLRNAGFEEGKDFLDKMRYSKQEYMTDGNEMIYYIRVGDNIIKYDEGTGRFSRETSIQDLEKYFEGYDIDSVIEAERTNANKSYVRSRRDFLEQPEKSELIALTPIDLERLGISIENIENQKGGNTGITIEQIKGLTEDVPEEDVEQAKVNVQTQMRNWGENQRDESTRDENE